MNEPTVTTNPPAQSNAMGGAPTTTQDVSGPIIPSAQPVVPSVQPAAPATTARIANQPTPIVATQPPAVSLHAHMFDKVLKAFGGGDQYITRTDPATGETTRTPLPQSRGQLGKNILAAAVTGMIQGAGARDQFGRHDPLAAARIGFQEGTKPLQQKVAAIQQASDEATSRKMMVMKANLDTAHLTLALNQGKQNMYEKIAANNQNGILKDALAYDQSLTDKSQPTAILKQGLSHDEALAALKGHWSDQLAQIDGYRQTENGDIVPTFTVLNPDVKVRMNEKSAADFARFNPQYRTAWDATDGNIQMSLHQYAVAQNTLNSLDHMDALFAQEAKVLGLKSTDFADAVKSIGPVGMKAVLEAENAIGGGGTPVDALRRLSLAQGGSQILAKLGITPEKVSELYNQQISNAKLAEMGGMGDKAPQADDQTQRQLTAINSNPDLTDADRKTLMADIPTPGKDGQVHMTQGQGTKLMNTAREMVTINKQIVERNALANGDPVQMQKTASNIIEGDVNNITKIASMRGNARTNTFNALHDEAVARGLDPTDFSEAAMTAKEEAITSYNAAGKIGQQIASFRTFLGHEAEAADANEAWTRMNSPLLNKPLAWIAKNASNDPNYIRLKTALGAPAKEYMSFLNANRAEHEDDIKIMKDVIMNPEATPLQINSALKELAKTADFRLGSLGKGYISTVGTTFPGLLDPSSAGTLKKFGVDSTAAKVAVSLPKGWVDGKAQIMRDRNVAKMYFQAAGNDPQQAMDLAKKNGWTLNIQ